MTPVQTDPSAQRKKYLLARWIRDWNAKHPADRITYAPGFDPDTDVIGTPARETLKKVQRIAGAEHVDGQFDRETMRLLLPQRDTGIRKEVMALAHSQLGIRETPDGSNWGPVEKYLKAAGIGFGAPWCASFVTWVLEKCGVKAQPGNPAWCPAWVEYGRAHKLLVPVAESRLGDLWLWDWDDGEADHIGFCDDTKPGDPVALYLDGNIGNRVTEGSRAAAGIEVVVSLTKLAALK